MHWHVLDQKKIALLLNQRRRSRNEGNTVRTSFCEKSMAVKLKLFGRQSWNKKYYDIDVKVCYQCEARLENTKPWVILQSISSV